MDLAVIIPMRNWSDRLPGKALVQVGGKPVIDHLVARYRMCDRVTHIVIATSTKVEDDGIDEACDRLGVPCCRGCESDVGNVVALMDRALKEHATSADLVFRGMGDCPLFEPALIDWYADVLVRTGGDLVWVGLPDDPWPIYGSRESPWSRAAWNRCARKSDGEQLEHAGSWIYENLCQFRPIHVTWLRDEYYRPYRLEMDTQADLRVIRAVYDALGGEPTMLDAIKWLDDNPGVSAINAKVELKSLTAPSWRRRGAAWVCEDCGAPAPAMQGMTILHKGLVTQCVRCGAERRFIAVPAFLAERRKE